MSDDLDIKKHTEYQTAQDTYTGALQAAAAQNDETAKLRAELEWERAQTRMERELTTQQREASARIAAIEKMKSEYPDVPETLFASNLDVATMETMAKQMSDQLAAVAKKSGQQWGPPPGGSGQPPKSPKSSDRTNDPEFRRSVNDNKRGAVDEFLTNRIRKAWEENPYRKAI